MGFVDWIEARVSEDSRRVMQHFDHSHTPEEAKACLNSIRESVRIQMQYTWLWVISELTLTVLVLVLCDEIWQVAAWFAFTFFASRLVHPWLKSLRKPVKWACRRLS